MSRSTQATMPFAPALVRASGIHKRRLQAASPPTQPAGSTYRLGKLYVFQLPRSSGLSIAGTPLRAASVAAVSRNWWAISPL
jgi:hypothetical protein